MSKDDGKKNKKNADKAMRKAAMNVLKNAPVIRDALIAAIDAGAAAAVDVIRKASDLELVKLAEAGEAVPEKKIKKKAKALEVAAEKPAVSPA